MRGHDGVFGDLLGGRVVVNVRVNNKNLVIRQQQPIHCSVGACASTFANDLINVVHVHVYPAPSAANHAVSIAVVNHHGTDQHQTAAHFDFGHWDGHAFARCHAVVALPELFIAFVPLDVDDLVMLVLLQAQSKTFDMFGNNGWSANQDRESKLFVNHNLHGTQYALFFAFGENDAFFRGLLCSQEDGAHDGARGIHKGLQLFAVSFHVGNWACGYAIVHCSLCHSAGNFEHQTWIKGLGYKVFGAKGQLLPHIGGGDHFTLLGLCQFSNGVHSGNFHARGDGGSAAVQRSAKDVGEAQYVIDLIGVVGAACCHDGVVAYAVHFFWGDFWLGVGKGKNQWLGCHGGDHFRLEYSAS